ncbi:response regulator [Prosthecomicrobium sp. N25]|uniref:response regulator n=1 Tax=Prosthecomicrobium sp. N25 TaxID=3129254 RepID=UPI00307876CD
MPPPQTPSGPEGAWTALVVEDEAIIAAGIEEILLELGARRVRVGRSPASVLLDEEVPDLAVIDWRLRTGTAADLVPRLLEVGTSVVIVTGAHPDDLGDVAARGIPILSKPFRDDFLAATIRAVLERRREERRAGTPDQA